MSLWNLLQKLCLIHQIIISKVSEYPFLARLLLNKTINGYDNIYIYVWHHQIILHKREVPKATPGFCSSKADSSGKYIQHFLSIYLLYRIPSIPVLTKKTYFHLNRS